MAEAGLLVQTLLGLVQVQVDLLPAIPVVADHRLDMAVVLAAHLLVTAAVADPQPAMVVAAGDRKSVV